MHVLTRKHSPETCVFTMMVYLTLKLDFNIKQQQMASSEERGGKKAKSRLDIFYRAADANKKNVKKGGEIMRKRYRIQPGERERNRGVR